MTRTKFRFQAKQKGSTLLVAVVILLLASLMALMAMNVGVFEQRSSGNDLRAKIVHQVAEAGLAQGFEYLMRARPELLDDESLWDSCAGKTSFPCGAVPESMRASMWHLKAGVGGYSDAGASPLASALTQYMLPNPVTVPSMGSFNVAYGVAPVLCRVANPLSSTAINCTNDLSNASDRRVVTFVSVAQVRGESGRTTLTQTVASSSLLAPHEGVPTIIASGSATPPGNGTLVPMPARVLADGSSDSNDLGVWTLGNARADVGSYQVCSFGNFVADETEEGWVENRNCEGQNCSCSSPMSEALYEQDVLYDVEDTCTEGSFGTEDIHCTKKTEFPCDLFEYTFGVKAWNDLDVDGFCETRIARSSVELPGVDGTHSLYPDEVFLYTNSKQIFPKVGDPDRLRADQTENGTLGESSSGLIWCRKDCLPNNRVQIGTVAKPVLIVIDSDAATNLIIHPKIIGMLFFRQADGTLVPGSPDDGATVGFNGGAQVFGSVIIQGNIKTGSGSADLVGDRQVIMNLMNNDDLRQYDTLRGGWTDSKSF